MKRVTDITIVLGPPGPEDEKRKFEGWSKTSGRPKEEIWLEFVHEVLRDLANRQDLESPSKLDDLFSRVLGTQVRVNEPFLTSIMQGDLRSPGVILYTSKIIGPNATPLSVDWSTPELREVIGSIFGLLLKTQWVRTFVAYEP